MSLAVPASSLSVNVSSNGNAVNLEEESVLYQRLKLVEDLWEQVLQSECGQELVDLLTELRLQGTHEAIASEISEAVIMGITQRIEQLELNDAIRAARAFALYFQLINIVEQHYEQNEQQRNRWEASQETNFYEQAGNEEEVVPPLKFGSSSEPLPVGIDQDDVEASVGTFQWLLQELKRLNVPPQHIQNLLDHLDIRLVITAHPTEIVRHTIRRKQRRVDRILRKLDQLQGAVSNRRDWINTWDAKTAIAQLTEEIRFWWRTDELHQFKPTVLDEVDYSLHYFDEVLFDAIPELSKRLQQAIKETFPRLRPPRANFCYFGSWVGGDRDGNPSVTPEVTWQTACYQRGLVLSKYLFGLSELVAILSPSLHWCKVSQELLDSLERDRIQLPEIYEELSLRYRQEPYRMKLAYVTRRLENTLKRNERLANPEERQIMIKMPAENHYRTGQELLDELRLIQRNLSETGLSCLELQNLITQLEVYDFNLAQLDFRQESSRHAEAIAEIAKYMGVLAIPYEEMSEADKLEWLGMELQTRRPLIPQEIPFSERTAETIETLRTLRHLQSEFGVDIC
ncbi:MAG: phosphoenolpyruvate carboxylase, partial [Synechocystis sp.]